VRAHVEDLRVEVLKQLDREPAPDNETRAQAFAEDIAAQGSEGAPDARLRSLLQYAERLALHPGEMEYLHVQQLKDAGFDERSIHDAAQATAYFAYINRIADGLGVDLEPEMHSG
jgi:uncharacterized protein YciW